MRLQRQTGQCAHADPCALSKAPYEHLRTRSGNSKRFNKPRLLLHYVDGRVFLSHSLVKEVALMHYGENLRRQRQCDALDNVLSGNPGSCSS